jgi:ABC-2 type transport system ATP-binding protein
VLADVNRSFSNRHGTVPVFRGLDLVVTSGERVAVVGPNGSGKSTLLRLLAGLILANKGFVRVRDRRGELVDPARVPGTCAAVFDGGRVLHGRLTVAENVRWQAARDGGDPEAAERATEPWLDRFDLLPRRRELVASLSKGTQQKIALACALSLRRPLLLLDEPTTLLDEDACTLLAQVVRERAGGNQTVIVATHDHPWRAQIDARSVEISPDARGVRPVSSHAQTAQLA